ncbi:hypothetical protein V5799_031294 [Amblyomma americanum]|uniref:DDE Tnp4 domain-containing protein n=1 Tax=Amblyomma americanum TaxID=6943 RepID=A0AAQ4ELQ5_AMBAM
MEWQQKVAALRLRLIPKRKKALTRKYWVRPVWEWHAEESEFFTAMKVMQDGDASLFHKFYRMSPETFNFLHSTVASRLTKEWLCREPISSGERLALTLRRCVENAFGILVSQWRIFERKINLEPINVDSVVKATCVLHNFLCMESSSTSYYCPPGYADCTDTFGNVHEGSWREAASTSAMFQLQRTRARNCAQGATAVRNTFLEFFSAEGQVPWQ